MRFLFAVCVAIAVVWLIRHPRERRTAVAMVRSGLVLTNLARSDYGTLQQQVLFGAHRQRCVAVNGVVRLPTVFEVTFAESDRPLVEPVEAGFFADVSDVLLTDAAEHDWVVAGVPVFRSTYSDRGRPGFPSVTAVGPPVHVPGTTTADVSSTRLGDDVPVTELRPSGSGGGALRLRDTTNDHVLDLDPPADAATALTVGRSRRGDVLIDDPSVSGRHAELVRTASGWRVHDCGSTNGTFVNGRPAARPTPLVPGDALRLGPDVSFVVLP